VLEANGRARVLRKSVFPKCHQWFARGAVPFREHVVVARKLSPSPFVRALITPVGYGAVSERPRPCVGDGGVPKEMLEASGIHSAARQCVSGGVAEHVDVDREWQPSGFPSPLDHAPNAHSPKRMAALVDEDIGPLKPVRL
jgi:hypothetical protein